MEKTYIWRLIRCLIVIGCLLSMYYIIKHTIVLWYPLLIVVCLTLICHPIASYLTRKLHLPRLLAVILTVTVMFIVLITFISRLLFELFKSMTQIIERFPQYFEQVFIIFERFFKENVLQMYKNDLSLHQQQLIEQQFQQMLTKLNEFSLEILQNTVMKMIHLLAVFPYSFMILLFVLIATILMTNDWQSIKDKINRIIPPSVNDSRINIMTHFKELLVSYLQAQLIIVLITAVTLWIGLSFLAIEHALTIVLITAFIDLLPLVGTGFVFIPWIIYLLIIGNYSLTIKLSILYGTVIILRQLIEPKIVSTKIGMRPLTVLISLFLSWQVFGAFGLVMAPFLIIFGHALYKANVYQNIWQFIKGN